MRYESFRVCRTPIALQPGFSVTEQEQFSGMRGCDSCAHSQRECTSQLHMQTQQEKLRNVAVSYDALNDINYGTGLTSCAHVQTASCTFCMSHDHVSGAAAHC